MSYQVQVFTSKTESYVNEVKAESSFNASVMAKYEALHNGYDVYQVKVL